MDLECMRVTLGRIICTYYIGMYKINYGELILLTLCGSVGLLKFANLRNSGNAWCDTCGVIQFRLLFCCFSFFFIFAVTKL